MSSEVAAAETWLYGVLSGDATLTSLGVTGVYAYQAPETARFPYVLFQHQGGADVRGVGPTRIMANMLYVVRGVTDGPLSALVSINSRIDALLQAQSGSNVNGVVLACVREQPFVMNEPAEGRTFRHLGGVYRLWAQ